MAQESPNKRLDVSMDRISSLPEPIICHILTFLPTKDAVKTTLLSPKFLNLWKTLRTLRFSYHCSSNPIIDKKTTRFVNFVNRVFLCFETTCIDKFSVELSGFSKRDFIRDSLTTWVAASVAKNVKILEVLNGSDTFKPWFQLPNCIFTCKSLETLRLKNVVLRLNRSNPVCLPNLRILRLEDVRIQGDECIDRIVSGCSSLHTLYLRRLESSDIASFSIWSPTLEHLTIIPTYTDSSSDSDSDASSNDSDSDDSSSDDSDSDPSSSGSDDSDSDSDRDTSSSDNKEEAENGVSFGRIKIDAPALKFLHLRQTMLKDLSIKTSSPLTEAEILLGAAKCDPDTCDNLILALSKVKILVLDFSDVWLEASTPSRLLPMFPNLTGLTLRNFSSQFYFLKELLRKSPTLETLDLKCTNSRGSDSFGEPNLIPGYKSPFLKMVTVDNFYGTTNQLKVLEYILLNARLLKTMKITTHSTSKRKHELLQEISNFRRKSSHCKIKFDRFD